MVLKPGNGLQEKTWPIETFFHKVVMIRNRLRTLEQASVYHTPDDAAAEAALAAMFDAMTSGADETPRLVIEGRSSPLQTLERRGRL